MKRVLTGSHVRIRSGHATDVGRVRDHNEDSVICDGEVFAVADGMGGHAAGEVASQIAVLTLRDLNTQEARRAEDVVAALKEANRRILKSANESRDRAGMGTTIAGLTVVEAGGAEHWAAFNVGDSRVYRFHRNRMSQVTHDHSEVRELLDAGLISAAEAARHPMRNVITRSLGTDPAPAPDVWVFPPQLGERFVICSDGLSNEVPDRDIMLMLRRHDAPQAAAEALVRAAVDNGGRDNVSVVVVAVDSEQDDEEDDGDTSPRHDLMTT